MPLAAGDEPAAAGISEAVATSAGAGVAAVTGATGGASAVGAAGAATPRPSCKPSPLHTAGGDLLTGRVKEPSNS